MNLNKIKLAVFGFLVLMACNIALPAEPETLGTAVRDSAYRISPSDIVELKVYQEDDLSTKVRIGKDGTATFPLIGAVQIGGRSVEQAAGLVRDLLDKDYLVNPQVTLTVVEYSKRRFTVLGQVQKPGSYEIPNEESMTLLEAIAIAGGYTRLANQAKITVTRTVDGKKVTLSIDGNSFAKDAKTKAFEVLPDDTITVAERIFLIPAP